MNPMRKLGVSKITLNIGVGSDQERLKKAVKLMERVAGVPPQKTVSNKRIPTWGVRPGLAIGCRVTLRGESAKKVLSRLLEAKEFTLNECNFDVEGNLSFGIREYIDIPGVEYDPQIKVMGLEVAVTLERPGYHVKRRRIRPCKIPLRHRISSDESIQFMKDNFNVVFAEEDEE